jgi:NAD(P)-dependent dehydrogenase (short-subunit alcohol dehydrogenase family)
MWLQIAQRTAIVTGAASGIGLQAAKSLLQNQCKVILADKDFASLTSASQSLEGDFRFVECDITNPQQVKSLITEADSFGGENPASILVNCAGITRDGWISKMSVDDFDTVIDVNLKGTFLACQAFLDPRRFKDTSIGEVGNADVPSSSIVNIGSVVSEFGNLGQANYAASKGGVVGLTRALAKEVAPRNVRVNAVLPGFIDTPMAQAVPEHVKEAMRKRIPLQRFGRPEEVADLICYLASPRSSYIHGEAIRVSGMIAI